MDPAHFIESFGELFLKAHLLGQFAVDPEVGVRFVLRFDRLLHSHVAEVGVRADGGNVNAFERSASRQNNVGKACRSRPHRVAHDRRFGTLPSLDQAIGVFLLGKGIAARPEDQTDVRIGDLLAVVVNRLAGVEEAVGKASQRNGRQRFADPRQTLAAALRVGGNAAQCGSHRSGRTAVGVVIAKAEATAGLADVAAHSSKHHHHPMNLFAVLSTLDTPATHQHGALFAHQVSQALDSVSLYVANLFCPFGGLRHAIGLAEHIGDELVVTHGVLADEFAIHLTGSLEFVRHTEHHGNVGTGLRSDPLAVLAEVFGRVRLERVDGNHGYAGLLHHFHAFGVFMDGRHPVDVVGDRRIGTPHHKEFTFFCEHFPSRLLFVDAVGTDHIGQDHLCATRGVVAVVAVKPPLRLSTRCIRLRAEPRLPALIQP